MGSVLTQKQEAFCQAIITEPNDSAALRLAYNCKKMKPETIHRKAHSLKQESKISTRIEQLHAAHAKRHDVTVDTLTEDCRKAIRLAEETRCAGAYVSGVQLVAKLHGLLIDRQTMKLAIADVKEADQLLRSAGLLE